LPEKYASKIAKGLKLHVTVDAWPGRVFEGVIQAVDPKLDEASRTLRVRGKLPNADLALKPGMFGNVLLDLATARVGLFVPEQVVQAKGSTATLFRIIDGKAVLTTVKIGERRTGFVEIADGLKADDWVVSDGQLKLRDGMAVMVIEKAKP
jgi:membrane fusion protein (multidrug efflux system)